MLLIVILLSIYFQKFKVISDSTIYLNGNSFHFKEKINDLYGISFYFKIVSNENLNYYNFLNIFLKKNIIVQLSLITQNDGSISLNNNNNSEKIVGLDLNKIYLFKFYIIHSNAFIIKITNINNINIEYISSLLSTLNNFNNLYHDFIINSFKNEIIVEYLIFYENNRIINNYENIPYNWYFINFKHNFLSSLFWRNEYKNEFGPSYNGDKNVDKIGYTYKTSLFNRDNKEILWIDNNLNGYFDINNSVFNKIWNLKLFKSHYIYIKFEIKVLFRIDSEILNFDSNNNNILIYYNNYIQLNIKIWNKTKIIFSLSFNNEIFFNAEMNVEGNNIINNSDIEPYIGLNCLFINFLNINNSNRYNYSVGVGLNNDSKLLSTHSQITIFNSKNIIEINKNINETVKYASFSTDDIRLKFCLVHKEFLVGIGTLKWLNNKIISQDKKRYFVFYDSNINYLERRLHLDGNNVHKWCSDINCSICTYDINICLFCYKGYYLFNNGCKFNTDSTKYFIDSYSILREKTRPVKSEIYNNNEFFPNISNNRNQYNKSIIVSITENNTYIIHFKFEILFNFQINDIFEFFSKNKKQKTSIYIANVLNTIYTLSLILDKNENEFFNGYNHGFIGYYTSNFYYKLENIDCNNNLNYINYPCKIVCNKGNSYLLDFDINDIRYGRCKSNEVTNKYKDIDYKIYVNCPLNCEKCSINNRIIICTKCLIGYKLNRGLCIQDKIINTLLNYNPNGNCSYSVAICNNKNAIQCYNNNNDCIEENHIILKCKDNYYLNSESTNCFNCLVGGCNTCLNERCINCKFGYSLINGTCIECYKTINNCNICTNKSCTKCNDGYYLANNLCFKCHNNCSKCNNYESCLNCKDDFILYEDLCIQNLVENCLNYSVEGYCILCNKDYTLFQNKCEKCDFGCLICEKSKDNCVKCNKKFYIENNKCINYLINNCLIYEKNKKNCLLCKNGYQAIINKVKNKKICDLNCKNDEYRNKNEICIKCKYNKAILIKEAGNYMVNLKLPIFLKNYNLTNIDYIKFKSPIGNLDFDIKIKNKLLILDIKINSFKKFIETKLEIENLFFGNNCLQNNFSQNFNLEFNIKKDMVDYISSNKKTLEKINPIIPKNSVVYNNIETLGNSIDKTFKSFTLFAILISFMLLPVIKYICIFFEFLFIIQIFLLLNIKLSPLINTFFKFMKIELNYYIKISNIININEESIRNNKLISLNTKILLEDTYLISNFSVGYFLGLLFLVFFILIKLIWYILSKYTFKINKKTNKVYNMKQKTIPKKKIKFNRYLNCCGENIVESNLDKCMTLDFKKDENLKDIKNEKLTMNKLAMNEKVPFRDNLIQYLKKLKYIVLYFYLNCILLEFPNIIFTSLIYIFDYQNLYYNGYFNNINILLMWNYFIIVQYFYLNIKYINKIKNKKLVKKYKNNIYELFVPYRLINHSIILYFQLFENIRAFMIVFIIIYFNKYLYFQLSLLIKLQILFLVLIFKFKIPNKIEKVYFIFKESLNMILIVLLAWKGFIQFENRGYDILVISIYTILIITIFLNFIIEFYNAAKNTFKYIIIFIIGLCKKKLRNN